MVRLIQTLCPDYRSMPYLLDSNILIEAKNRMPIDLFPSFWSKLYEQIVAGNVFSSVKVKDEIKRGNVDDPLVEWVNSLPESFFLSIDAADILAKYAQTINWANQNTQYSQAAKVEFASASIADAFLVATAAAKNMTLVTHEVSDSNSKKRVKIPDAAKAVNVTCCDLIEMLRNLKTTI